MWAAPLRKWRWTSVEWKEPGGAARCPLLQAAWHGAGRTATLRLSCPRDAEGVRQAPPACQAAGKVRWRRTLKVNVTVEGEDF